MGEVRDMVHLAAALAVVAALAAVAALAVGQVGAGEDMVHQPADTVVPLVEASAAEAVRQGQLSQHPRPTLLGWEPLHHSTV